jgi:hypothetical protein
MMIKNPSPYKHTFESFIKAYYRQTSISVSGQPPGKTFSIQDIGIKIKVQTYI